MPDAEHQDAQRKIEVPREPPHHKRHLWTIVTFSISLLCLLSLFHEVKDSIIAVDRELLKSLGTVQTWSLLQSYQHGFDAIWARNCYNTSYPATGCTLSMAIVDFIPLTFEIAGRALHRSWLSFFWIVGGILLACTMAYQALRNSHGNYWPYAPFYVLFMIFLESLFATVLVLLLEGALTAIGIFIQIVGFLALPAALVRYLESGHTVMAFVESTKELAKKVSVRPEV